MRAPTDHVRGQLMVRFTGGVSPGQAEAILAERRARVLTRYADPRLFHIALPADLSVEQGVELFQALGEVEFAEPNMISRKEK